MIRELLRKILPGSFRERDREAVALTALESRHRKLVPKMHALAMEVAHAESVVIRDRRSGERGKRGKPRRRQGE